MEVDNTENYSNTSADAGKFNHLKAFVNAAREFEATHSESAINLMTRYLGLIASSCDLSIFSPGRTEVCAFFSSLWRAMCDVRGPHWAGLAVLARASIEPSARHALTHTYKFLPILARLLSDTISNDKKIKLLSVMQEISYGIKISWQESYLSGLMKQLTEWITQPITEPQHRTIGHKSLTVLVNICYGNLPAIYALMRNIDTKEFVSHLISLKDAECGGVEVCRLLVCVSGAARGAGPLAASDLHSYLCCTMRTFHKAILEKDATQLLHAYTFMNDLCSDKNLHNFIISYPHFAKILPDSLKGIDNLCSQTSPDDMSEQENMSTCLRNVLKFLTVLVNLDIYTLRDYHNQLVCLCMKASGTCLPESLELFAAIVAQYKDEGSLPKELILLINDGLPGLLVPPSLEPGKAGLQWLQVVSALCETAETQERVLREVSPEAFEDTLYSVLEYTSQGSVGGGPGVQAAARACRAALALAPLHGHWQRALTRLLAHHQVRKLLCSGLTSADPARRKQILQLVKHHYFPSDQMNQVFGESAWSGDEGVSVGVRESVGGGAWGAGGEAWARLSPAHEHAVDDLVEQLNKALHDNKISDVATSSVMELYGYKMNCLEQRLHSHSVALQGATEQMASLQHSLAMVQATAAAHHDVLYTTQMQNEKHKKNIEDLHKQLEDCETTLRGYRAKITAVRLDKENQKENLHKEFRSQIAKMEAEMKEQEKMAEEKLRQAGVEYKNLQKKLDAQANKNSELAGVLIKFEERVKQRDKRLEDAAAAEQALRKEMEHKDNTIKQLEKTVLERENRLYQVTMQLEEMKRVQEMVAKLMSKSANNAAPS